MPELRKDPVVGRWVIISTERARRPSDVAGEPVRPTGQHCVFCEGDEARTPPEVAATSPGLRGLMVVNRSAATMAAHS